MGVIVFDRKGRILKDTVDYDALRKAFVEMMVEKLMRRDIYADLLGSAATRGTDEHNRPGDDEERGAVPVRHVPTCYGPH